MNTSFRVPPWRTFLNWVIAVAVGSIMWPLIAALFERGPSGSMNDMLPTMAISAVLSGLTSIPAILIILWATWLLNKRQLQPTAYRLLHTAIHLFVGLLTFSVLYVFAELGKSEVIFFLILMVSYLLAGMLAWAITFTIYARKPQEKIKYSDELIDGSVES